MRFYLCLEFEGEDGRDQLLHIRADRITDLKWVAAQETNLEIPFPEPVQVGS